jgi:hypothetical protein
MKADDELQSSEGIELGHFNNDVSVGVLLRLHSLKSFDYTRALSRSWPTVSSRSNLE